MGEARLDRRGILVGEMVAWNDLIVLNRGRDFTFRRGVEGSIIDLTISAPRLASRIGGWCVLEVITLSDHRCIEFGLQERSQTVDKGRGSKGRSPSSPESSCVLVGTQDDSAGKDYEYISEKPGSLKNLVGSDLLGHWKTLCDRRGWRWSQHAITRCLAKSTAKSRARWVGGMSKRLVTRRKNPDLDNPDRVTYIVGSLFPHVKSFQRQNRRSCVVECKELFTLEELKRAGGRLNPFVKLYYYL